MHRFTLVMFYLFSYIELQILWNATFSLYLSCPKELNFMQLFSFLKFPSPKISCVAVIDDAMCEQRLWDMKYRGVNNFYMCELRKDFTIDATFKGNSSRFLNHSCDPNCKLEKWLV